MPLLLLKLQRCGCLSHQHLFFTFFRYFPLLVKLDTTTGKIVCRETPSSASPLHCVPVLSFPGLSFSCFRFLLRLYFLVLPLYFFFSSLKPFISRHSSRQPPPDDSPCHLLSPRHRIRFQAPLLHPLRPLRRWTDPATEGRRRRGRCSARSVPGAAEPKLHTGPTSKK